MSNLPTLPDADAQEPLPDEEFDDDLIGEPLGDDDGIGSDLPEPLNDPVPGDDAPGGTVANDFA
ncbi:hypothetical protein GCM10011390_20530 [Aureimonas endophytica]|uniref:Uncharacterized protein n=1 Tax=Aureimonas endophytica TaxID=2027858 RepID=A0A916ZKV8_9HYPH|nr:hypothetical protein [Aureimonas endophytica]GGE01532.1 hypothetical protein GCM10011390_20530 [Aureimonas endophytica]